MISTQSALSESSTKLACVMPNAKQIPERNKIRGVLGTLPTRGRRKVGVCEAWNLQNNSTDNRVMIVEVTYPLPYSQSR